MAQPSAQEDSPLRVKEGDTVIVDVNEGDKQLFVTVRPKSKIKLGNSHVSAEPLAGCLYGTLFTLSADGKELVRAEHKPSTEWATAAVPETSRNNATLVDGGTANQQLTAADIEAMRAEGKGGEEIVAALAAASATFATKTEFSQEKYKKKKAKKYIFNAVVRRPTAATVCQVYYAKQPARIGHLRLDTLSLLLSLANVGAHARVLVLDTCGGMVTAAVAERLGGFGSVTAAHTGSRAPGTEALRQFNFPPHVRATIRTAPLHVLAAEAAGAAADAAAAGQAGGAEAQAQRGQPEGAGAVGAAEPATAADGAAAMLVDADGGAGSSAAQKPAAAGDLAAAAAQEPQAGAERGWAPYTSCIIAAPALSPTAALDAVLPLLAPSTPFAVYSHWTQPLAEAMSELQASRRAVGLSLQETWWRDHQVLPARTHPMMSMDHGGGFLLSGTTVVPEERGGGGAGSAGQSRKRKA